MPPSERLTALSRKAVLVAARKADPAAEALRKEFDARATAWVIVLDARGELLDAGFADRGGALKKRETAETFAGPFLDRIERSLERRESLQDLERRWKKDPLDEGAVADLAARLDEMAAYTRLREFCDRVAETPGLPAARRADARLRAFVARPREFNPAVGTPEGRERFVADGERLVLEHADHPACSDALQALFASGYCGRFDMPAHAAAGAARLEAQAGRLKDPAPLRLRIAELARLREEEISKLRAAKGDEASEGWAAAMLGDAEETIRIFSKPPFAKSDYYQGFVKEAQEKLRLRK